MAAPQVRQSTAFYAPGTATPMGTAILGAWPNPTLAGSRIVTYYGVTSNGDTGITASATVGGTVMPASGTAIRQSAGADVENIYAFQLRNTGGTAAVPHVVTGGGTASHYQWGVAVEVTGDDATRDVDIPAFLATGAGTAFTVGPSGLPDQGDILWLGGVAIPNIQAMTVSGGFSQVTQGGSGGSGASAKATGLVAKQAISVAATASLDVSISSGNTRQYAAILLAIPATPSGGGGGGGYGGSPRAFPLGPPDMTGATTLTDPNPSSRWAPKLTNGVSYIINCPTTRSAPVSLIGGADIYIPKLLIRLSGSISGAMFEFGGGDNGRIIHVEQFHLDPNGFQCDAMKSQSPGSGRILQLKVGRVEKLLGETIQVHADLLQSSGGLEELWIEDYTGYTTYDGFMMQREANVEQQTTFFTVTAASVSGSNYVYTSPDHTYTAGDAVGVYGLLPSAYNGGFTVLSVSGAGSSKKFTVKKGDSSPGTATQSGHVVKFSWAYDVGAIHFNRVNVKGFHNDLQGTSSLQSIRFGARTAPTPNSGSPGTVTGYTKQNEDQTPLNADWWGGTLNATDWYANPDSGNVGQFVEPDSGTANYSVIRPVYHTASGTVPAYADWPNHPSVGTATRIYQGDPPGGDYVVISGGLPIPTAAGTASGGTAPAPVNTSIPVIQPSDPSTNTLISVNTLGGWSNVDGATSWTLAYQDNLGGTASWADVQATSGLTSIQAQAMTLGTAPLSGYAYRLKVIADNGSPGTAFSLPTNLVTDYSPVTLEVDVE